MRPCLALLNRFAGRCSIIALAWIGLCSLVRGQVVEAPVSAPTIDPIPEAVPLVVDQVPVDDPRVRYSAEWIASQAASRMPLGNLMRSDLKADQSSISRPSEQQKTAIQLRYRIQEYRIARQSQIAAAKAMEIHFGLATIEALSAIQTESRAELNLQQQRQDRAMEMGLGVIDPGAVARSSNVLEDQRIEAESKASQLRSQLALLVGTSIACSYLAEPMETPPCPPPKLNACDYITEAYSKRCDLQGLIYLRRHLTVDTLEVARWMSDILTTSAPTSFARQSVPGLSLIGMLVSHHRNEDAAELCARLRLLDDAAAALREKIASEVDLAVEKQRAAAERYCNVLQRIELWQTRIEQLRKYGDHVKPMLEAETEAVTNWYQARAEAVQRQGDWHQAVVELCLAVGALP